jgi:hypothetical protein
VRCSLLEYLPVALRYEELAAERAESSRSLARESNLINSCQCSSLSLSGIVLYLNTRHGCNRIKYNKECATWQATRTLLILSLSLLPIGMAFSIDGNSERDRLHFLISLIVLLFTEDLAALFKTQCRLYNSNHVALGCPIKVRSAD